MKRLDSQTRVSGFYYPGGLFFFSCFKWDFESGESEIWTQADILQNADKKKSSVFVCHMRQEKIRKNKISGLRKKKKKCVNTYTHTIPSALFEKQNPGGVR